MSLEKMSGVEAWKADKMEQRLLFKCHSTFEMDFDSLPECYSLLSQIVGLELKGAKKCAEHLIVGHNPDFHTDCGSFEILINRYALPIFQLLCLLGNLFNLLIYRLPYFHGSSAVHLLQAKAIANLIFVESRLLEAMHAWGQEPNARFETIYWQTRPIIITVANISGTLSTWMTLFVSVETVLCVLMPFSFRRYCTRRRTMIILVGSIICSAGLHLMFLITHKVTTSAFVERAVEPDTSNSTCWRATKTFSMQPILIGENIERAYYWITVAVSIIVPTIVMLFCSVLVVTKFSLKGNLGEAFSQRRRCVIRLTIATTMSHLLLEGPAVFTFVAAAMRGASSEALNMEMCVLNHANNLLSIINATIPFFVFLSCNDQFRCMSIVYLKHLSSATKFTSPFLQDAPSEGPLRTRPHSRSGYCDYSAITETGRDKLTVTPSLSYRTPSPPIRVTNM